MKNIKRVFLLFFLIAGITCYSQEKETKHKCFTDQLLQKSLEGNPDVKEQMDRLDNEIIVYKNKQRQQKSVTSPIIIPVVIYVINAAAEGAENISNDQINGQINALNTYYENSGIQFCIATKKGPTAIPTPSGGTQTTPGIIRMTSPGLSIHDAVTGQMLLTHYTSGGHVPAQNYLRIWIVKDIVENGAPSNILGYSMFPGQSSVFDGIVIKANVFGDIGTCSNCLLLPGYNQGKTLAHEVGHFLNLHHTFYEGCTETTTGDCETKGDRVCDTPPAVEYYSCAPGYNSCNETDNEPDDTSNFMAYGNDNCINHFTEGQKERMHAAINLYRSDLISIDNQIFTATCGSDTLLSAAFEASNFSPCSGANITFSPLLTTGVTYNWNFGDPASGANNFSTLANPSHTYTSAANSPFTVTLTVTNGTQTVIETDFIYVNACTPIQSPDDNWFFGTTNGLTFTTGTAIYNNSAALNGNLMNEAAATQSNNSGQLLFYSNGINVWNNLHAKINTGTPLLSHSSAHSGTMILPKPGNASQYYIFTQDEFGGLNGLRYSIVNISGTSATMAQSEMINVPITPPPGKGYLTGNNGALITAEGITAIASCNGYWIITGGKKSTGYLITVYELTASGIQYISEYSLPTLLTSPIATIKASPDGNKITYAATGIGNFNGRAYLLDFNKINGIVSNLVDLKQNNIYGACFSPNSKVLYLSSHHIAYQYDLRFIDPVATMKPLYNFLTNEGEMQIGPDNKIYISGSGILTKMGVIHRPNEINTGGVNNCLFTTNGPVVGSTLSFSLPNLLNAKLSTAYNNTISYTTESCFTYRFAANVCGQIFNWNFGDPTSGANTSTLANSTHTFSGPGTYTITLNGSITTQIIVGGTIPVISGSTTACVSNANQTYHFTSIQQDQTVKWSIINGAGSTTINTQPDVVINWTSLPGTVRLTVTDANGCITIKDQTIGITEGCTAPECDPNIILNSPETGVTETYSVSNNIVTQDNYQVAYGKDVTLIAANSITIKPNSWIKNGAVFLAEIAPCVPASPNFDRTTIEEPLQKLTVYPNPTAGELHLSGTKIKEIYLFDVLGKNVFYSKYDNVNDTTIDISGLQQGMYFMKVISNDNTIDTIKIVKD